MARVLQFGVAVRNARLDAFETRAAGSKLEIYSGTMPANCGLGVNSGTVLAQIILPSDWMADASGGSKSMLGTWTANGLATGTASYFRFKHYGFAGINTVHCQGNIVEAGSEDEGAMELDDINIVLDEPVTVTLFTLTDGNA